MTMALANLTSAKPFDHVLRDVDALQDPFEQLLRRRRQVRVGRLGERDELDLVAQLGVGR